MQLVNKNKIIDVYDSNGYKLKSQILKFEDNTIYHFYRVRKINEDFDRLLVICNNAPYPIALSSVKFEDVEIDMGYLCESIADIYNDSCLSVENLPSIDELKKVLNKESVELIREVYIDYTNNI